MNHAEQHAKNRPSRAGVSLPDAFLRYGQNGVSLRRHLLWRMVRAAVVILAVAAAAALSARPAAADVAHVPLFKLGEIPTEGPHGELIAAPGPLGRMEAMTVDSGHLWVAEKAGGSRIDEFDAASGAFMSQLANGGDYGVGGIAVGHGLGEAVVYAGSEVGGVPAVSIFNEAGVLKGTWKGVATPESSFGEISGVAVDNSSNPLDAGRGDVFVATTLITKGVFEGVIDVFHPETDGEERYVGQITGVSPSSAFVNPRQIAVNEANGDLVVLDKDRVRGAQESEDQSAVDVFEPTGLGTYKFVGEIGGPPPSGLFHSTFALAVDGDTGDIYVTEFVPGYLIHEFSFAGTYLGRVENIPDAYAIAVDPSSHDLYVRETVYSPGVVTPDVAAAPISNPKSESVTLNGSVNPDGAGNVICEFEWGSSPSLGKTVPCSEEVANGEGPVPVHAPLSGLERGGTYYYRLAAQNTNGRNLSENEEQFTVVGAILREGSVSDVGSTSATFAATVDPGSRPTSYYFQYGTSTEYGVDLPASPGESVGSGTRDVEVPDRDVQGLTPGTTYHYRVVVISEPKPGEVETIYGEDRTFTTQVAQGSFALADGRQWELVSPANKLGALIKEPGFGLVQAAADGGAISYSASSPTENDPAGYAGAETVLSRRGGQGWSSQDISESNTYATHASEGSGYEYEIFSEDLSRGVVQPQASVFTPLSSEANESTPYLRANYADGGSEGLCGSSCYRPLVTSKQGFANVPSGTVFGEEPNDVCEVSSGVCGPLFQGASPDLSHIVLSSPAQLTGSPAPAGGPGLYEWAEGSLQLLDVLPEGEEGPAVLAGSVGHDGDAMGVRGSVSENGERVVLEGGAEGGKGLYLRDTVPPGETIRLDVPQGGSGPSEGAVYMDATPDASRIFFLDSGRLMADSSPSGDDLYEYDLNAPVGSRLSDLTVAANAGRSADVAMMIGASEDGSYVYFAAAGALVPGAFQGGCPEDASGGGPCNLYVRHEGVTRLVAVLPGEDVYDWSSTLHGGIDKALFARVSPNGRWLAFLSDAELTGYDTHDAVSGKPDIEVYLYGAASGKVTCASCNPTGARPVGEEAGSTVNENETPLRGDWVAASVEPWVGARVPGDFGGSFASHQPRYLSDEGRLFFDSTDALVAQDVDGVEDAYEYEPSGVGSCSESSVTFSQQSGGCVSLLSAGTSPAQSEFVDASETGGDVFFRTRSQLVSQDYDTAYDVYDAQECTGAVPCYSAPISPPSCETESSCRTAPTPQPALYGAPSSATFSGTGNVTPSAPVVASKKVTKKTVKCKKGYVKNKKGKCAKKKRSTKAKRAGNRRRASR